VPDISSGAAALLKSPLSEERMRMAGVWAARQLQPARPKAVTEASKGKTNFDALIDKWMLGVQPERNAIQRTRMHARRFEEMACVHTVEDVTRQHAIQFVEQLRRTGQTPQNINMHLASLIKTNEASGLAVKVPNGEKARRSFDLPALKGIFSSPVYTAGHRPKGGGGDASYWVPLLALFTGARLEGAYTQRPVEDCTE
jgi:hypothetical protein